MQVYKNTPKDFHKSFMKAVDQLEHQDTRRTNIWSVLGNIGIGCTATVVAFVFAMVLCAMNPVKAAGIPIIGDLFSLVQDYFGFGKLPEEETHDLLSESIEEQESSPIEENGESVADEYKYVVSDQGFTVQVEQYYASNQALFLGIRLYAENGFGKVDDRTIVQLLTTEKYSFREGDPKGGEGILDGTFLDDHTYAGVLRIAYEEISRNLLNYGEAVSQAEEKGEPMDGIQVEDYLEYYEIPKEFDLQLSVDKIFIYSAGSGKQRYEGNWEIPGTIHIEQSEAGMQVVCVNDVNELGFGLSHIEFSPVEMTIHPIEPADHLGFAVVLDRDGRMVRYGGENCYELALDGHDISEITIYICDYDQYMDEIKRYAIHEEDAKIFETMLEENYLYKKVLQLNSEFDEN
ncbi:MAG: hypothetical protein ACI4FY_12300 [Acetatifactor sp.]